MKQIIFALVVLFFGVQTAAFALPQAEEGMSQDECVVAPEQVEDVATDGTEEQHRHYWHCTAYPEGHGHHHGYSYRDRHYSHARRGAIRRCERATHHHCHDVHCHRDHH